MKPVFYLSDTRMMTFLPGSSANSLYRLRNFGKRTSAAFRTPTSRRVSRPRKLLTMPKSRFSSV